MTVTKINPYDLPKPQYVQVEMFNIEWNTEGETPPYPLPPRMTVTVDLNQGNLIAQAIDKATEHTGYAMSDVDFKPIDFDKIIGPPESDDTSETLEIDPDQTVTYDGEIY